MNTLLNLSETNRGVGVLKSTLPVVECARHVWIDERAVKHLSRQWAELAAEPPTESRFDWSDGTLRGATIVLVLNAWNFCFWAEPGKTKWSVELDGRRMNGYQALVACVKRALAEGIELYDPTVLSRMTQKQMKHIFRGKGQIPMLRERTENAKEVGRVLLDKWEGDFINLLRFAEGSAVSLTELVVENFPSFDDSTLYFGREVKFYKRAQILVADLHQLLSGDSLVDFHDLTQLSAFADYKIPQVLEAHGVLRYSPELQALLQRQEALPQGDTQEVEIRACMVWAVEALRLELEQSGRCVSSHELDWMLWNLGQQPVDNELPYHRTRTKFY